MSAKFVLLDDAVATLRRHGLTGEIEEAGSGHFKVRFVNAFGSNCLLVVSRSPSHFLHGANAEAIRQAVCRDERGQAMGPLGAALDFLAANAE